MTRNGMRIVGAVLAGFLVLGASACGGGSSDSSSSDDGEITASVSDSDDSGTSSSGSGSSSGSSGDLDDLGDAMEALGGDCMQAALAYFALSMQALGASFGMDDAQIQEMEDSVSELKAEIPSEIEDEFQVYADALAEYANAMKDMNLGDLMSGSSEAEQAAEILQSDEVVEAQAAIEAYFDEECPNG